MFLQFDFFIPNLRSDTMQNCDGYIEKKRTP